MPYINVNDAYILDNTGKQVDDAVDYALANSNRNLLDNPFFTVNQREYTSNNLLQLQYWADRWLRNTSTSGQGSLSLSNGIVTLTAPSGSGGFGNILQRMADPSIISGKVVTLSLLKSDGTIIGGSFTRVAGTSQFAYNQNNIKLHIAPNNAIVVQVENGASISFKAVKLELGSYSTLANDVPPDYGEELRKCQRYFLRIPQFAPTILGYGTVGSGGGGFTALIPTPVPMRPVTSISGTGAYNIRYGSGAIATIASVTLSHTQPNGVVVTGPGTFTGNAPLILFKNNTGYTDISADL